MFQGLTGWHGLIIVFIILLLFGAPKLPGLAKSLGQSMRILKKEVRSEDAAATEADPAPIAASQSTDATAADQLAQAKAEAAQAKAEAEALRAASEKRESR